MDSNKLYTAEEIKWLLSRLEIMTDRAIAAESFISKEMRWYRPIQMERILKFLKNIKWG
jgi:hypothetical protein